jgi:hypothetical protein
MGLSLAQPAFRPTCGDGVLHGLIRVKATVRQCASPQPRAKVNARPFAGFYKDRRNLKGGYTAAWRSM